MLYALGLWEGGSLICYLVGIKAQNFRRKKVERIILIIIGVAVQLVPIFLEVSVIAYKTQWIAFQKETCTNEGLFFSIYIFCLEMMHVTLPLSLIIYMILEAGSKQKKHSESQEVLSEETE